LKKKKEENAATINKGSLPVEEEIVVESHTSIRVVFGFGSVKLATRIEC
jgi:hypothetical protein